MKVIAKKNRELALINAQNTQNENRAETITLVVPEEYENYNKKIVFITSDGNVWDVITNNEYKITNAITKYKQVDFYIWLTKEVDGESIDFRTKTKTLNFYHNVDASDEITDEEIHGVNTVVNLLEEEIDKVENLNLEAEKVGTVTTITITKKDGTTQDVEILDGYTPQKGTDYFTQEDIEEIENGVKTDLEENVLVDYSLITETGSKIDLSINTTNYKLTAILKDKNNNIICTSNEIDLPLETMVVSASYDNTTKEIILTLQNGNTVRFSVADLVAGLQAEITSQNKLASDLVDDTNSENKFVTPSEKQAWNAKYDKPSGGIPKTDLASDVQTSLGKADTAIQAHQDISGKEDKTNKVTSIDNTSTDTQYPSAKCVYDSQVEQNTDIENLQEENARLKATLPTTTGEGQDITLNKTAEMEFVKPPLPMGNSEQDGEPSPTNEVPINNVTGDVEVVVQNKNLLDLLDINRTSNGITATVSNQIVALNGTAAANAFIRLDRNASSYYFNLKKGTYTLSANNSIALSSSDFLRFVTLTGEAIEGLSLPLNLKNSSRTFTINEDLENIQLQVRISSGTTLNNFIIKPQLEKGSTATPYTPHKEQVFTFPLGNEKLMLGYYLADDGIHHVRGQVVLDGTETWALMGSTETYYEFQFTNLNPKAKNEYTFPISSHFSNKANNRMVAKYNTLLVRVPIEANITTVQEFKTWLSNNNVTVEYILEEEIIVSYTSAQQEVYNQIKQALSYEGQTNISSNQNAIFDVEAYQSTKLVLQDFATAIVALGGV